MLIKLLKVSNYSSSRSKQIFRIVRHASDNYFFKSFIVSSILFYGSSKIRRILENNRWIAQVRLVFLLEILPGKFLGSVARRVFNSYVDKSYVKRNRPNVGERRDKEKRVLSPREIYFDNTTSNKSQPLKTIETG